MGSKVFEAIICIIKILESTSSITLANSFLLIDFTWLVVGKVFAMVNDLYISPSVAFLKSMSAWLKKKGILRTNFMLVLANKKVFSKNLICLSLSIIESTTVVISKVLKAKPSIF